MSMPDVREALQQGFVDGAFNIQTFIENEKFTPPNGVEWAMMFFLPNEPEPTGLGLKGEDLVTGILQVDLNYPLGRGTKNVFAKYEEIRKYFFAGRKFTVGTSSPAIISAGSSAASVVNQNYRLPVNIVWEVRIQR